MFLFEKGIGKLKNISKDELKTITNNLPKDWGYSFVIVYESSVDEKYNKYNVKLFRKKTL
jgi:hypothetical protein